MKYEYMSFEEIIVTMTDEEWNDLMTDCYIDDAAAEAGYDF